MALLSLSTEDLKTQQEIYFLIIVMRPAGEHSRMPHKS